MSNLPQLKSVVTTKLNNIDNTFDLILDHLKKYGSIDSNYLTRLIGQDKKDVEVCKNYVDLFI